MSRSRARLPGDAMGYWHTPCCCRDSGDISASRSLSEAIRRAMGCTTRACRSNRDASPGLLSGRRLVCGVPRTAARCLRAV
jgi:hypothetical protein